MKTLFLKYLEYLNNNDKVFVNINNIWTIKFGNEFNQFNDSVPINYLYYLIKNPHKPISLAEIMSTAQPNKYTYNEIKSSIEGNTIDFETRKEEIKRELTDIDKKVEKLNDAYHNADSLNNENEMLRIDAEKEILENEKRKLLIEMSIKPTNISEEWKKCANIVSKQVSLFKSLIAKSNMGDLYLHIDNCIKVENGCKYTPSMDTSSWCTAYF